MTNIIKFQSISSSLKKKIVDWIQWQGQASENAGDILPFLNLFFTFTSPKPKLI